MTCDFLNLATPGVQQLQPYQPGKPLSELEREYGITHAIKLASNENPQGASPTVIAAIKAHLGELSRYPDGNGFALKKALAQKLDVDMAMITLGNGSNDVLELIARAFVTPQDTVIFSEYAFAVYPLVTQAIGAQAIVTPAKNWGHDLMAMQAAIKDNTRILFIANPNNPTGTWVDKASLQMLLDAVPTSVVVVVDEAYFEYALDNPDYPNSLAWLDRYPNLIVCRTFSKAYGLAGLRVGYAISHPTIADLLNRVRQPFNVNSIALIAAETALQDTNFIQHAVALNREGLHQLKNGFTEMGVSYINTLANFLTVEVGDGMQIFNQLLYKGIITRPLNGYNMPKHLRVSSGLLTENAQFLDALKQILEK